MERIKAISSGVNKGNNVTKLSDEDKPQETKNKIKIKESQPARDVLGHPGDLQRTVRGPTQKLMI